MKDINGIEFDRQNQSFRIKGHKDYIKFSEVRDVAPSREDIISKHSDTSDKFKLRVKIILNDDSEIFAYSNDECIERGSVDYHDGKRNQEKIIAMFKTIIKKNEILYQEQ